MSPHPRLSTAFQEAVALLHEPVLATVFFETDGPVVLVRWDDHAAVVMGKLPKGTQTLVTPRTVAATDDGRIRFAADLTPDAFVVDETPEQRAELYRWVDERLADAGEYPVTEELFAAVEEVGDEVYRVLGLDVSREPEQLHRNIATSKAWEQRARLRAIDQFVQPPTDLGDPEGRYRRVTETLADLGFSQDGRFGPVTRNSDHPMVAGQPFFVSFGWGPEPVTLPAGEMLQRALYRAGFGVQWQPYHPMEALEVTI